MRLLMFLFIFACTISCTELDQARYNGGSYTMELPRDEVLLEATWKESELWILTKDTVTNVTVFKCYNGTGGKVIFK